MAHPLGGHRVDHHLAWTVDHEGTQLTYVADVPHAFGDTDGLLRELQSGLHLSVDGKTHPLELDDHRVRAIDGHTRMTLHLRARHGPGELVLSDGTLLDATARVHRTIDVGSSLNVTRAPTPTPVYVQAARRAVMVTRPANVLERWHRWATRRPIRPVPTPEPDLRTNTTTPALAVALLAILPVLARPTEDEQWWSPVVAGIVSSILPPELAILAAALCLPFRPTLRLTPVFLAGSTDVTGLGVMVGLLASSTGTRGAIPRAWTIAAMVPLVALQVLRIGAWWS